MIQDRLQAVEDIIAVILIALDGIVAAVVGIVLGGLEAVGDFARVRDPVRGCLEIRPGTGAGIGLKVRGHGCGADDRGICRRCQRQQAENEEGAEEHTQPPAPHGFGSCHRASYHHIVCFASRI